jgi:uncharacterized repeat protein (TIGR01451 family)
MVRVKNTTMIGALFILALMSVGVSGLLITTRTLQTSGTILGINIDIYSDSACTQPVSSLDWGTPEPGDTVNRIIYLKNTGNTDMNLNMMVSSWYPSGVDNHLSLSWDRENTNIAPNEVLRSTISLSVDSGITGISDFSFQITLQGTG